MHGTLAQFLADSPFGYIVVFFGMILEGDVFLFTAAFLTEEGYFHPGIIAITVYAGVILGDLFWYALGLWLDTSSTFLTRWAKRIVKPFEGGLQRRPLHTIFISKFTYGFSHAVLMRAGSLRIPLKKFFKIDAISSLGWMAVVGGLGYFSGASFSLIKHYLKVAEIALLFVLVAFFVVWHLIINRSREKL